MTDLQLVVDNISTQLKFDRNFEIDKELIKEINREMSYKISEYCAFRKTHIDFNYSLFDKQDFFYPTGLFSNLHKILTKRNIEFEILDKRTLPDSKPKLEIQGKTLRDYQLETVEKSIASERGIIKIATGGGKTVIAAAIIAELNLKTLFVVNSVDLLEQAYDEFRLILGVQIGRIGGGYCNINKINVCTIQTIHSALGIEFEPLDKEYFIKEELTEQVLSKKEEIRQLVQEVECIIVDETHHLRANTYVELMKVAKRAYFRFGMSATPYKMDSTDLILNAYSGKEIINISASYLIDRNFLVKPTIYFLDPNEFSDGYQFLRGRFSTIYKKWIVNNSNRNDKIVHCLDRFMELDKTVLITVSQVVHGDILLEKISKSLKGVESDFIKGEVKKEKRKELLNKMRKRKLKILIGTSLADEGLDLSALDAAIMAGGGKSLVKSLQRVGRTLRPYPNVENNVKKQAIIVDFYDHLRYLTGQSKKRMNIYRQEPKFEVIEHF